MRWTGLVLAALTGCSFTFIHYPDHADHRPDHRRTAAASIDCDRLKLLPVVDTVSAIAAASTAAQTYNTRDHTTPWPIAELITAGWALASASYGFYETERCWRELGTPPPRDAFASAP